MTKPGYKWPHERVAAETFFASDWAAKFNAQLAEEDKLRTADTFLSNVLQRAQQLVDSDRQAVYGTPKDNMRDIGKLWGVFLEVGDIPPRKVALMLALLKISREVHTAKQDNLVDGIGYLYIADIVKGEDGKD